MEETLNSKEYKALARFRAALIRYLGFGEAAAGSVGLTPQRYQALLFLVGFSGEGNITVGELAELMNIKHHSAVGLIDRMEAQGLVQRTPARQDRRQVYVNITSTGREKLDQLAPVMRDELRKIGLELRLLLKEMGH